MKANELIIGNYVKFNKDTNNRYAGEIGQFELSDFYAISEGVMDFEDIEGIPLTEEILLKAGFEKDNGSPENEYLFEFKNSCIRLVLDYPDYVVIISGDEITIISYLHELQNLFLCLVGRELEIKP